MAIVPREKTSSPGFTRCAATPPVQSFLQHRDHRTNPRRWPHTAHLTRLCLWVCTLCFTFFVILYSCTEKAKWYNSPHDCFTPPQLMGEMRDMLYLLNYTLSTRLRIPYFLCYGTLWGAIRHGDILQWDNNIDVCVLSENISSVCSADLTNTLLDVGISSRYNRWHGLYDLRYESAVGRITVLRRTGEVVQRSGWASWVFPFLFSKEEFPYWLVEGPLPHKDFVGSKFPVPRGNFEIMMFVYPDDWWFVAKPPGC